MAEHQYTQQSKKTDNTSQKKTISPNQIPISHPATIIQRARINPKYLNHADVIQLQHTIGNRAVGKLLSEIGLIPSKAKQTQLVQIQKIPEEEKEPLQGKMVESIQRQQIPDDEETCPSCMQKQETLKEEERLQGKFRGKPEQATCPSCSALPIQQEDENRIGMPDNLKAGVESLSGIDVSDVRVHYNSDKPEKVGALAYTQRTDIHVAPEQERHLPHEAWHVVQQAQGRLKPTLQMKDRIPVNDDEGLEHEADLMGDKVLYFLRSEEISKASGKFIEADQQLDDGVVNTTQTIQARFTSVLNHWDDNTIKRLILVRYSLKQGHTEADLDAKISSLRNNRFDIPTIDMLCLKMKDLVQENGQNSAKLSITPPQEAFSNPTNPQGRTTPPFIGYRADGRLPDTIHQNGFFPILSMGKNEIIELLQNPANAASFLQQWISSPETYRGVAVSYALDEDCGGQIGAAKTDECVTRSPDGAPVRYRPIYKVSFPGMYVIAQNRDKSIIANAANLQQATIIGMKSKVEVTIFTGVPGDCILIHKFAQ